MGVGVRTQDLRKVYHSPPPMAAAGAGFMMGRSGGGGKPKAKVEIVALNALTLDIHSGEIFGLLGPNGAGKSTTMGILTTRIRPTSGSAWIGDKNVWDDPVSVKRLLGVVPQRPNLDFALTAREVLLFHGAYFGLSSRECKERAGKLLDLFQLTERADQMSRTYSGGMMQRLSIARAMMHDPQVLFLDEPSAGLDPQTRHLLWEILRDYNAQGKTVVLATHYMEEADELCGRIAIIDHGGIITAGVPAELKRSVPGGFMIRLRFGAEHAQLREQFQQVAGVREARASANHSIDLYTDRGGALIPELVGIAVAAGAQIQDLHIEEPGLETLFLHHTGRSLRD